MRHSALFIPLSVLTAVSLGCSGLQISSGGRTYDVGKALGVARDLHDAFDLDAEKEHELGREISANLIAKYGIYSDEAVTRYVNLVGLTLARRTERKDIPYRFGILKTRAVGAYAVPGGYIFLTRGLLLRLESEAQLAGVLAHEIQHVDQKHGLKALRKSKLLEAGAKAAQAKSDNTIALQIASGFIVNLLEKGFERGDERDADSRAVPFAEASGYASAGLQDALDRLYGGEHAAKSKSRYLKGHPPLNDRLTALRARSSMGGAVLKKRYLKNVAF